MKRFASFLVSLAIALTTVSAQTKDEPIDFNKARQFLQREQRGEKLNPEEQAYLTRAKEERAKGGQRPGAAPDGIDFQKAQALRERSQKGEKLNPEEQAYLDKALAARSQARPDLRQRKAPEHLAPLTDMTAQDRYEGEDGGLYGGGSNTPPPALRQAAEAQLARIQPLDAAGKPAADGRIVFVSISMSNATMEFSTFKRIADPSPKKGPQLTIVDCAQGGQAMAQWAPPDARPWAE